MPNLSLFASRSLHVLGAAVLAVTSAGCATEGNNAHGAVPTAAVYNRPAVSGQALRPDRPVGDTVPDTELRANDLSARPASTRVAPAQQPVDGVDDYTILMVNQNTIKFSHVFRMIEDELKIQASDKSSAEFEPVAKTMFHQALESEIYGLLIFDDGWNALRPEEREQARLKVDQEIKRLMDEAGGKTRWNEQLKSRKTTAEQMRVDILRGMVTNWARSRLKKKVTVRPDEIFAGYDKIKEQHSIPGGVKFRVIEIEKNSGRGKALPAKADATPLEVRDHIQQRLKEGDDFAELAKKFSDFKAGQGGLWDDTRFIQEDSLKQRCWTEALAKLKTGQCTANPVEGDNGNSWYFFKVDQRVGVTYKSAAELEDVIRAKIEEEKLRAEWDVYIEGLRKKAWISRPDYSRILAAVRKQITTK